MFKKKERNWKVTESSWATGLSHGPLQVQHRGLPHAAHMCVCAVLKEGSCPAALAALEGRPRGQLILASQPRWETIGLEAPLAPMPWHIWKLLTSIPSPTPHSLRQLFLVANSGKYPSVVDACRRRGRRKGGPHPCVGGWEGGGQAAERSCESPRRAGLLLPWPHRTAGRVTRG